MIVVYISQWCGASAGLCVDKVMSQHINLIFFIKNRIQFNKEIFCHELLSGYSTVIYIERFVNNRHVYIDVGERCVLTAGVGNP